MKRFLLAIILFISVSSVGQIINSSFIAPDTVCVNQTFSIQNTSTGSINSTYWNFCTSSVALTQSVNLGTSASSFPVFMSINNDAGVYYAFVSHNSPGGMSRFNFGSSLNNIPTSVNLGSFSGQMPGNSEGIVIEKEGTNWYGVVVGGPVGTIARMNFGTSLANSPTVVNMGNIGALSYPHRLKVIHSSGNKYGFAVNRNSNTVTRLDFGNSLNNLPVGTNLGNLGGLSGPNDFDIVYVNGNWHMFITNDGNNTLTRLDFGNSLLNTPTGTNLGTIGVSPLRGISIDITCGGIKGQVTSQFNTYANLNFPTGPTGPATTSFVGNTGFSFPHSIEKYRVGDTVYTFVPNANGNSLTRIKYASCTITAVPNSTLTNLPPMAFPFSGTYTVSILNNSNQYNQSVYCKTIVAMGNTITATASPSAGCSTGFTTTLTVTGNGTFTWDPGSSIGNSVVVTPTANTIYTAATTSTLNCGNSQTVAVAVIITPTLSVSATSLTICSGSSTSLSASGASGYTWMPGNIIASSFTISPTSTTIYTVVGANGICSDTKTIQIDVNPTPTVTINPTVALVCLNSTLTLTGGGATNYTWTPGTALSSTNTAITQANPTVTTTYSLIGSTGTCTNLAVVQLSVIGLPTVVISQPSQTLCSNNIATLSASGAGTYTWNPGNLVGASVTVSPTSNTIYTVMATAGTCTGSATATINVVTSPTVTANSSSLNICSGTSITLSSSGGNTYTWNPGNIVGGTVTVFPPAGTIVYTVTGDNGTGCTHTAAVSITVDPSPTITIVPSSPSVCSGNQVSLTANGASTYTWLPGSSTGSILVDNPLTIAQYTVFGTVGNCSSAATATLMVVQNPTVAASTSPTIRCNGQSSTLVATGASNYNWAPNSFLSTTVGGTVFSTSPNNVCYTVTGFNSFGCSSTASVCITVTQTSQTFTAIANPSVMCSGSSVTLTSFGAITYTYFPPLIQNTNNVVVSPTVTSVYNITGRFSDGCITTQTLQLNVQPTPTININSIPGLICLGDQGSLEGSGATTYTWLPSSSNNTNIIVTPTATTTYTLFGQTGSCIGSSVTTVTVNPKPNITALVLSPTLCLGRSTDILASGANNYTWQPNNAFGFSVNVSPTVSTTYTINGEALGCSTSQTVDVLVVPNPAIFILNSPTLICLQPLQNSTLTAGGANTFTWLPNSATTQSISVSPSVTSMYTVSGTNSNGCVSSNTIALNVDPDLVSTISATQICSGQTITLTANGALSYSWMPGNFSLPTVNIVPDANTTYTIVGTSGICSKTGTLFVEIVASPIHDIPEVFTPNDDGKNDLFVIRSETLTKINIKVFNRWGALVYSHAEYDNSWNGTANAGMMVGNNKLPQGTYYYVIDLESCDKQAIHGYVVIQY